VKGITCPPVCNEERWLNLNENIRYKTGDVIVCSYPKSGTTWIEQVVLLLQHGGDATLLNPANKNVYSPSSSSAVGKIWPEACIEQAPGAAVAGQEFARISWEDFDSAPSPRLIKSHAPSKLLLGMSESEDSPIIPGVKVILVSRNPLDSCVSRYYHAFNPYKCGWTFDAWAAVWLSGNTTYGSWFDWVKHWHKRAKTNEDRILWLQYEEMKLDPAGQIRRIAEFLGVQQNNMTPDLTEKVLHGSSFASMKEQSSSKGGDFNQHLRKGMTGDWRNHFSDGMKDLFLEKYHAELHGTGLVYYFGDSLGHIDP
jgi:sulfotransferase